MMRGIVVTLFVFAFAGSSMAKSPPDDLIKKLTETIRTHCPDATIEVLENDFTAKHGTMVFTMHGRSKTGEVYARIYEQEGPNFKGFMLSITLHDGRYEGAAMVPQTLQGPYFPTFIDAVDMENGMKHYQVHFSYGSRLDRDLMKTIFEAIPKSRLQQSAGEDAENPAPQQ